MHNGLNFKYHGEFEDKIENIKNPFSLFLDRFDICKNKTRTHMSQTCVLVKTTRQKSCENKILTYGYIKNKSRIYPNIRDIDTTWQKFGNTVISFKMIFPYYFKQKVEVIKTSDEMRKIKGLNKSGVTV